MNKLYAAAALAAACMLSACHTTGAKMTHLYTGNSEVEVRETLGRPDAVRTFGDYEVYTYLGRHHGFMWLHHADYSVVMENGKVVQFGPGLARREGLHTVVIVPPGAN